MHEDIFELPANIGKLQKKNFLLPTRQIVEKMPHYKGLANSVGLDASTRG